jgi:hypothetical protein
VRLPPVGLTGAKISLSVFNRAAAEEAKLKMPSNVTVRTAHSLAFRSVGHVYKSRLAGSPWAWFPYLEEKMPRALDLVMRQMQRGLYASPIHQVSATRITAPEHFLPAFLRPSGRASPGLVGPCRC